MTSDHLVPDPDTKQPLALVLIPGHLHEISAHFLIPRKCTSGTELIMRQLYGSGALSERVVLFITRIQAQNSANRLDTLILRSEMISFDHTRALISAALTKMALAVLPIVALITMELPVKASVVFAPASCAVDTGSGVCAVTQMSLSGGVPGANWLQLYSGEVTAEAGEGTDVVDLLVSGSASGTFSSSVSIPVSWNFDISNIAANDSIDWFLFFEIDSSVGSSFFTTTFPESGTVTGSGSIVVKGSDSISYPSSAGSVGAYTIELIASSENDQPFNLIVPASSTVDLNPAASTTVPEPSTMFLVAAGISGLFFRRKRQSA
jgi:hypothetical protein